MTTYDLDTLTLSNVGEEATGDNREAYAGLFLNAYNEAFSFACNVVLKPEAIEAVGLDSFKRFDPAGLQNAVAPGGILAVKAGLDYTGDFGMWPAHAFSYCKAGDGKVAVPDAQAGAQVYVTYRVSPAALLNGTPTVAGSGSVPELMPGEYHGALACYAAAVFFRVRRKFERMQVWMDAWMEAVQQMRERQPQDGLKLRNAYLPMP